MIIYLLIPAAAFIIYRIYRYMCWRPCKGRADKAKRRILCIGDSITFGAGVLHTRRYNSYPAVLGRLLGNGFQVLNYGVSGAAAQREGDIPYPEDFRSAAAKTLPEICIFMLGTNDSKPQNRNKNNYEASVKEWIEEIQSYASRPRLILMIPPAAFPASGGEIAYSIQDDVILGEIADALKSIARNNGLQIFDLYSLTKEHPEWFADGVHPNKTGNRAIAEYIFDRMKEFV